MIRCRSVIDRDTLNEVAKPICRRYGRMFLLLAIAAGIVLAGLLMILTQGESAATRTVMAVIGAAAMAVVAAACSYGAKKMRRKTVAVFLERLHTLHHTDHLERTICMDEDHIWEETDANASAEGKAPSMDVQVQDVTGVTETPTQLLIACKGNLYLWVEKNSLQGGTIADVQRILTHS